MNIIPFKTDNKTREKAVRPPVYLVYAYRNPNSVCGDYNAWDMKAAKACPIEAADYAKDLCARNDFEKIEVYKRYFCFKTSKVQDKLYKTYSQNSIWRIANFF